MYNRNVSRIQPTATMRKLGFAALLCASSLAFNAFAQTPAGCNEGGLAPAARWQACGVTVGTAHVGDTVSNANAELIASGNPPLTAEGCGNQAIVIISPRISITKQCVYPSTPCGGTNFPYGSPISFAGLVCNTGNTNLVNITVNDFPNGPV